MLFKIFSKSRAFRGSSFPHSAHVFSIGLERHFKSCVFSCSISEYPGYISFMILSRHRITDGCSVTSRYNWCNPGLPITVRRCCGLPAWSPTVRWSLAKNVVSCVLPTRVARPTAAMETTNVLITTRRPETVEQSFSSWDIVLETDIFVLMLRLRCIVTNSILLNLRLSKRFLTYLLSYVHYAGSVVWHSVQGRYKGCRVCSEVRSVAGEFSVTISRRRSVVALAGVDSITNDFLASRASSILFRDTRSVCVFVSVCVVQASPALQHWHYRDHRSRLLLFCAPITWSQQPSIHQTPLNTLATDS